MGYQVRRIDPFWKAGPVVLSVAVAGALVAMFGYTRNLLVVAFPGGVVMALAVLIATKPSVSAVLGSLGLLGGLVTFVVMPSLSAQGMSIPMRLVSALFFAVLYMVLMDALALVVSALYNLAVGGLGLSGVHLDIDTGGQSESEG
jgi:hypothetical protein